MLDESTRNWLVQLEIDTLRTGKMPDVDFSEEEKASFDRGLAYLKKVRDRIGPEAFSKITIDVGYDM